MSRIAILKSKPCVAELYISISISICPQPNLGIQLVSDSIINMPPLERDILNNKFMHVDRFAPQHLDQPRSISRKTWQTLLPACIIA